MPGVAAGGSSNPVYVFTSPDVLTTSDNALIPWLPALAGKSITKLRAIVKTAPTGAGLICNFKRVTMSTGVIGASIGTVTIAAGDFTAEATISDPVLLSTEALAMEITQVGSTVAGANLTATARGE